MFKDKLEYLTNQPEILDKLMKSSYEELLRWKKHSSQTMERNFINNMVCCRLLNK